MTEKLRTHERDTAPEKIKSAEINVEHARRLNPVDKSEALDLNMARAAIEEARPVAKESLLENAELEAGKSDEIRWWSKELGRQTFDRTLASVRRQLSAPEKQLSKFIHKPVIEKTSDVIGKTIARPSGILLGGIFSFLGSLAVYLIARHLGGEIRYSIFAITFACGYLLGLLVELAWRLATRKKSPNS